MVVEAEDISDEQKARICKKLAEADKVTLLESAYVYILISNFNISVRWLRLSL